MLRPASHFAKSLAWIRSCVAELTRPPAPDISRSALALHQQFLNSSAPHEILLLRNLQARFPIVGVFAPPAIRPPLQFAPSFLRPPVSHARGLRPPNGSQLRTIITNPGSFGHQTQNCLTQYQYPAFARNFSTAKAPCLFQPVNAQASIFTNIATKPFSAINQKGGYLLNQSPVSQEPVSLKIGRYDADEPSKPTCSSHRGCGPKLTEQSTLGLYAACSEAVSQKCNKLHHGATASVRHARLVRRGSKPVANRSPLAVAAQCEAAEGRDATENGRPRLIDGVAADAGRTKPPDRSVSRSKSKVYITMRLDGNLLWDLSVIDDGTSSLSESSFLDVSSPFTSIAPPRQLTRPAQLTPALLTTFADLAEQHQNHLSSVLALLRTLSRHGDFSIEIDGLRVRVHLDLPSLPPSSSVSSLLGAAENWLRSVGIDPSAHYFSLEVVEVLEKEDEDEDGSQSPVLIAAAPTSDSVSPASSMVFVPSSTTATTIAAATTTTELGPEYFAGIRNFLNEIESGPALKIAFGRG